MLIVTSNLFCQNSIWSIVDKNQRSNLHTVIQSKEAYPLSYALYNIDNQTLLELLQSVPKRSDNTNKFNLPILNVPLPNGKSIDFYIEEASIMHPKLQSKFPDIQSYAGYGVNQKEASLRFDYSHKGFHFQILSSEFGTIKIDPVDSSDQVYLCYFKKDLYISDKDYRFECDFDHNIHVPENYIPNKSQRFVQGDNKLREYRLAVACTGEYANYHGGTTADAAAAINTTMNRVIGIYERDFSITMTLIANNDEVIYLDGATDPFTNGNAAMMISENMTNMDNVIGFEEFDIGHLFGTAGSGLAYLDGPCQTNKAGAVTAIANPIGDFFDVDYVCHEMGHQFGANHTQYNSCNKNPGTAMEPGSASTIMGYAGICSPNVQSNSDDYFHAISIEEIEDYTTTGNGNNCPVISDNGNGLPSVSAGSDYTIPKSTPFVLTADGSDPDEDSLTYCWEQMDNEGSENQPPQSNNEFGPMFRSIKPTVSKERYFPSLVHVINNNSSDWEVLSSVERVLNFRVTVRDNVTGNGLTAEDDCLISVDESSGPFVITNPNTGVQWNTGEMKTVTWNVANTNVAPVSCTTVDILLSVDGGYTYDYTLASNVSNDGSESITVPNIMSSFARVRVMCSNNIFYDISDVDFGVNAPPFPDYCIPTFNNASCSSGDYIDDVIFETINNTATGCAISGDNYSDYTTLKTVVVENSTYTLTVKPNESYAQYFAAYIDWNLDGDFLDSNEFIDIGHVQEGVSESVDITIPSGTIMGEKLFRILCRYGTNALTENDGCASGLNYGEVEDYMIEVIDPCDTNITVTQNYGSGDTQFVNASNNITAANVINPGADIIYSAGVDIDLNPGFEVMVGASFEAYIGPCQQ